MTGPASGYEQRFGALLAHKDAGGVLSQPWALYEHQHALGLTEGELVYLAHVFNRRRNGGPWTWVANSDVAAATGRSEATVYGWVRSLRRKGYVHAIASKTARGRQGSNRIDLTPLLAQLERLAATTAHVRKRAEMELPPPSYDDGMLAPITQPPAQRIYEPRTAHRSENSQSDSDIAPGIPEPMGPIAPGIPEPMASTAPGIPGASQRELTNRERRQRKERQTGLAPASRAPGRKQPSDNDMIEPIDDDRADEPIVDGRPTDLGIAIYVEEWAAEFGDDDPERSLATVTHWWWSSGLPDYEAQNAMSQARHETRKRRARLRRPMAYAMTALHTALSERCVKHGLPPLPGAPPPLDEVSVKLIRAERIRGELAKLPDLDSLDDRTHRAAEHLAGELASLEAEIEAVEADSGVQDEASAPRRRRERVVA